MPKTIKPTKLWYNEASMYAGTDDIRTAVEALHEARSCSWWLTLRDELSDESNIVEATEFDSPEEYNAVRAKFYAHDDEFRRLLMLAEEELESIAKMNLMYRCDESKKALRKLGFHV